MDLKKVYIGFLILTLLCCTKGFGEQLETKASPNYLIILVHGINGTGWGFRGHGEYGSDVSKIPEDKRGFADLLGYLRNELGLDGYVYYYTFSERDGRLDLEARELGDPTHDNMAKERSIVHHKKLIGH